MSLILGSTSPRRREILDFFAIPFTQASPHFDESLIPFQGDPIAFAKEVAIGKAQALKHRFPHDVILTADTIVYQNGKIFLKPESLKEAHAMLKELSGKEHQVFTGVAVLHKNEIFSDVEQSRVFFHELTEPQIQIYHENFHPLDKAGGYAIQKAGSLIVKRIEGCYYNIMGLPIHTVRRLLLKAGIDLWDFLKPT
ncbi:MAG: septum formation protein Maf [Verrucomicrobia bacterium]|nr:septum formation protein Maf [Verrucomicrobiota bacterium]MBU6446118.1 septum formation protein Maf [Verrucomicrobiota bacterium]MDE3047754.1 septum formation protein Maf [Verrucomicrobiota bacterium]